MTMMKGVVEVIIEEKEKITRLVKIDINRCYYYRLCGSINNNNNIIL